jgi:ubiquinone/menaquinone biosynthesis C-methylase UbiE
MADDKQTQYWLEERHLAYHRRQFAEPYRSTVFLGELIGRVVSETFQGEVLDVACGVGAGMAYLGRVFPNARFTGVDIADEIFPIGLQLMREQGMTNLPRMVRGDIYKLEEVVKPRTYDIVLSIQTLSWVPTYEPLLGPLLAMAKPGGTVIVSSLYSEALVDAKIELKQYTDASFQDAREQIFYNIYCLERFVSECKRHGAASVEAFDFEMDRDLPRPSHRHMGTYTERLLGGRRIQLSGPHPDAMEVRDCSNALDPFCRFTR